MPTRSNRSAPGAAAAPPIRDGSSFTPESFERELKSLAAKAKDDTWARAARRQVAIYARVLLLLTVAAASANASVAALSPVFGAIPAGRWHSVLVASACFAGWSSNLHLRRLLPEQRPLALWLPLLAAYLPVVQFYVVPMLGRAALMGGARWAPAVAEALTLFPLLASTVACVATELEAATGLGEALRLPGWIGDALPGIGSWSVFKLAEGLTEVTGVAAPASGAVSLLGTRIVRQMAIAVAYVLALPFPMRASARVVPMLLYALPALLHSVAFNTHVAGAPWALAATNRVLGRGGGDDGGWLVLDRRESVTGYVSVVENLAQGFRVLRCDHSLLGGEWTRFPANPVAEPIYGVFVMLEAVRLVQTAASDTPDTEKTSLVVGLGIGTAPAALVAHGIDTTVVEIDPAVHDFASRYFHLPANHTAVLEDAVAYTDRLVAVLPAEGDTEDGRFDYIVHDVFTGGAEPIALFTLEFLENLHALLKPSGVIAINYAGDFGLAPIKAVLLTIRAVFPACRIFREHPRQDEGPDFANVVVFCTKSGRSDADVQFRAPRPADLLNSETRKHFLVPQHEVFAADLVAADEVRVVRRNDTEQLAEHHAASALGHWEVMRRVIPAEVWEMW